MVGLLLTPTGMESAAMGNKGAISEKNLKKAREVIESLQRISFQKPPSPSFQGT
ncbi:MAG: hypothetical protein F6K10_08250 [Moorea sp. SIO2B7]|nr:hypothetical protein [Moorena sp. SIO2B7]